MQSSWNNQSPKNANMNNESHSKKPNNSSAALNKSFPNTSVNSTKSTKIRQNRTTTNQGTRVNNFPAGLTRQNNISTNISQTFAPINNSGDKSEVLIKDKTTSSIISRLNNLSATMQRNQTPTNLSRKKDINSTLFELNKMLSSSSKTQPNNVSFNNNDIKSKIINNNPSNNNVPTEDELYDDFTDVPKPTNDFPRMGLQNDVVMNNEMVRPGGMMNGGMYRQPGGVEMQGQQQSSQNEVQPPPPIHLDADGQMLVQPDIPINNSVVNYKHMAPGAMKSNQSVENKKEGTWHSRNKSWFYYFLAFLIVAISFGMVAMFIMFEKNPEPDSGGGTPVDPTSGLVDVNDYLTSDELANNLVDLSSFNGASNKDDFELAFETEIINFLNNQLDSEHQITMADFNFIWNGVNFASSGNYEFEARANVNDGIITGSNTFDIRVDKYLPTDLESINFEDVDDTRLQARHRDEAEIWVQSIVENDILTQMPSDKYMDGPDYTSDDLLMNYAFTYTENKTSELYPFLCTQVDFYSDNYLITGSISLDLYISCYE